MCTEFFDVKTATFHSLIDLVRVGYITNTAYIDEIRNYYIITILIISWTEHIPQPTSSIAFAMHETVYLQA